MKTAISFQKKLTLGFSLVLLTSLGICGLVSAYFTSRVVRGLVTENLVQQIRSIQASVEISSADNNERHAKLMDIWGQELAAKIAISKELKEAQAENQVTGDKIKTLVPVVLENGKALTQHELVDKVAERSGEAVTLFARIPEGLYRVSTSVKKKDGSRNTGTFIPNDTEVAKAVLSGKRFSGRALVAGQWYLTTYEPILRDNKVEGAVFLGTPETSYGHVKNYLKAKKLFDTGYFYILDQSGSLVLHPSLEGQNVLKTTDLDGQTIFQQIIERKTGTIQYRWMNNQTKKPQEKLAIFEHFPEVGWYVAASVNLAEAEAPVYQLRWILFVIVSVLMFAMISVAWLFGRRIAERLKKVYLSLEASSTEVTRNSAELTEVAQSLAQASILQASSLQQTASAVEEIRATVLRNLDTTETTGQLSKDMTSETKKGQQILSDLNQRVVRISSSNESMRNELQASHEKIAGISTLIASIDEKTKVINEIVFQTRLLSFNASVEAARAGEHGKGFSIVAEEVGRLASLSGQAAREISQTLLTSREEVDTIIREARAKTDQLLISSREEIAAGLEISRQCEASFRQILNQVSQTDQQVQGIASASKEQTDGIQEISSAVVMLDQVTQQNSAAAQQLNALAKVLDDNSQAVAMRMSDLKILVEGRIGMSQTLELTPRVSSFDSESSTRRAA